MGGIMLRTIAIGTCVLIQGLFVRQLAGGLIEVRVGDKVYAGKPVVRPAA